MNSLHTLCKRIKAKFNSDFTSSPIVDAPDKDILKTMFKTNLISIAIATDKLISVLKSISELDTQNISTYGLHIKLKNNLYNIPVNYNDNKFLQNCHQSFEVMQLA